MTDAETAYAAAEAAIAEAKAEGKPRLNLSGDPLIGADFGALVDLPPEIAEMTGLEYLNLSHTQISDISALAGMTGIQMLNLGNTQVSDISALADITGLQGLWLDNTQVSDISALAGMTGIQMLNLNDTQISDISTLAGMTRLQSLGLDNTQISDIAALAGMSGLQRLLLYSTQISDLRPLKSLTNLTPDQDDDSIKGLYFFNTPATRLDPKLETFSQIEDNRERTRQTLAYLNEIADHPKQQGQTPEAATPPPAPTATLKDRAGFLMQSAPIVRMTSQMLAQQIDLAIRQYLQETGLNCLPDKLQSYEHFVTALRGIALSDALARPEKPTAKDDLAQRLAALERIANELADELNAALDSEAELEAQLLEAKGTLAKRTGATARQADIVATRQQADEQRRRRQEENYFGRGFKEQLGRRTADTVWAVACFPLVYVAGQGLFGEIAVAALLGNVALRVK